MDSVIRWELLGSDRLAGYIEGERRLTVVRDKGWHVLATSNGEPLASADDLGDALAAATQLAADIKDVPVESLYGQVARKAVAQ
jgi:hypothetical protein